MCSNTVIAGSKICLRSCTIVEHRVTSLHQGQTSDGKRCTFSLEVGGQVKCTSTASCGDWRQQCNTAAPMDFPVRIESPAPSQSSATPSPTFLCPLQPFSFSPFPFLIFPVSSAYSLYTLPLLHALSPHSISIFAALAAKLFGTKDVTLPYMLEQ